MKLKFNAEKKYNIVQVELIKWMDAYTWCVCACETGATAKTPHEMNTHISVSKCSSNMKWHIVASIDRELNAVIWFKSGRYGARNREKKEIANTNIWNISFGEQWRRQRIGCFSI